MRNVKIGDSALEVLKSIIKNNPKIKEVVLKTYETSKSWGEINITDEDRKENFLDAYSYIDTPTKDLNTIKADKFLEMTEEGIRNRIPENCAAAILSYVKTDDGIMHIPMMNLHPSENITLDDLIERIKFITDNNGVLLRSGRYHHYYGDTLLNQREWERLIGKFLIAQNLIHQGYAGYRLHDGFSSLRITSNKDKPQVPMAVHIFGD